MREVGRWVLLLLLVLGVPLKTLAATSGLGCLQGHDRAAAHGHAAPHDAHGQHLHGAAAPEATAVDLDDDADAHSHSCSACAPCCAAAAPAPDATPLHLSPSSPARAAHVRALTLCVVAEVPHRPPR